MDQNILQQAWNTVDKQQYDSMLLYDIDDDSDDDIEMDKKLVNHVIDFITRAGDGRLRRPLFMRQKRSRSAILASYATTRPY